MTNGGPAFVIIRRPEPFSLRGWTCPTKGNTTRLPRPGIPAFDRPIDDDDDHEDDEVFFDHREIVARNQVERDPLSPLFYLDGIVCSSSCDFLLYFHRSKPFFILSLYYINFE